MSPYPRVEPATPDAPPGSHNPHDTTDDEDDDVDANRGTSSPYPSYKEEARHLETTSSSMSSARASFSDSSRRGRSSIERGRSAAVNRLAAMPLRPSKDNVTAMTEPSVKSSDKSTLSSTYYSKPRVEEDEAETDPSSPEAAAAPKYDSYGHKESGARGRQSFWSGLTNRPSSKPSQDPPATEPAHSDNGPSKKRGAWFSRGDKDPRMEDDVSALVAWLCSRPPTVTELQELEALSNACSASDPASKAAARALRKELKRTEEPESQKRAIRVWAFLMHHAQDPFARHVASKSFLEVFEHTVSNVKTSLEVKHNLLQVWAMYAHRHRLDRNLRSIAYSYNRVRPADMPEDGLPFDEHVALPELQSYSTGTEEGFPRQDDQGPAHASEGDFQSVGPAHQRRQSARKSFDPKTGGFISMDKEPRITQAPAQAPPPTQASHFSDDSSSIDAPDERIAARMEGLSITQSEAVPMTAQEREDAELARALELSKKDYEDSQIAPVLVTETVEKVSEPLDVLARRPPPPLPSVAAANAEQSFIPPPDSSSLASPPTSGQVAPVSASRSSQLDRQSYAYTGSGSSSRVSTPTQPTEKALGKRRAVSRHGSVDGDAVFGAYQPPY